MMHPSDEDTINSQQNALNAEDVDADVNGDGDGDSDEVSQKS